MDLRKIRDAYIDDGLDFQNATARTCRDVILTLISAGEDSVDTEKEWFKSVVAILEKNDLSLDDVEYAESDRENVRRIYAAMRDLPLAVAIDQRFWSGLAHTDFWDYVQYRRRAELAAGDDNAVKISYFFTLGPRRSAHVNCLSRLW